MQRWVMIWRGDTFKYPICFARNSNMKSSSIACKMSSLIPFATPTQVWNWLMRALCLASRCGLCTAGISPAGDTPGFTGKINGVPVPDAPLRHNQEHSLKVQHDCLRLLRGLSNKTMQSAGVLPQGDWDPDLSVVPTPWLLCTPSLPFSEFLPLNLSSLNVTPLNKDKLSYLFETVVSRFVKRISNHYWKVTVETSCNLVITELMIYVSVAAKNSTVLNIWLNIFLPFSDGFLVQLYMLTWVY